MELTQMMSSNGQRTLSRSRPRMKLKRSSGSLNTELARKEVRGLKLHCIFLAYICLL